MSVTTCPCVYFDWCGDEDLPDACACGHSREEHDTRDGTCEGEIDYDTGEAR